MRHISDNMTRCSLKSTWPCFLQNQNCQKKNKNWACIHELKCLLVYKEIHDGADENTLCKELAEDEIFAGIGKETQSGNIEKSREFSIRQKIYNINSLSKKQIKGLRVQENASKTTIEIFEICKNWSKEKLEQEIKKLENEIK